MMQQLKKTLGEAMERSMSHNEAPALLMMCPEDQLIKAIGDLSWDFDWAEIEEDFEGRRRLDVWGWSETTPEGEQDWRLAITLDGWLAACDVWGESWITESLDSLEADVASLYEACGWGQPPELTEMEQGLIYADLEGNGEWRLVASRL